MTHISRLKLTLAAFFAMLAITAGTLLTAATPTPLQAGGVNDANIVAIVSVADGLDIDYGKIALSKSKNKQVREFAQRMVTDHSAVQKSAGELAGKLGVKPEENPTSKGLAAGGVTVKAQLNKLKGKDFDKYYIDNEVAYHALVVKATEETLIPGAQNAELKATLVSVLPLFQKHLEHAQQVQAAFGKMPAKGDHKMGMNH
jgi:putative membrane protein